MGAAWHAWMHIISEFWRGVGHGAASPLTPGSCVTANRTINKDNTGTELFPYTEGQGIHQVATAKGIYP
jgi:hypothetical protein